MGKLAVLPAGF